ncbi:MAG: molybdenum cofactor biosynthesis protein MoaE [Candidatus Baldrarchaeia archaeon]
MASLKKGMVHRKGSISLMDVLNAVRANPELYKAGAIVCFIGIVRGIGKDGSKVKKLEIEAAEEEANEVLSEICEKLMARDGIVDVHIHHFFGEFEVGEDLVYVVIAGRSRKDVFRALKDAVEMYKSEAPLWKKEYTEKGEYWVIEKHGEEHSHSSDDPHLGQKDAPGGT